MKSINLTKFKKVTIATIATGLLLGIFLSTQPIAAQEVRKESVEVVVKEVVVEKQRGASPFMTKMIKKFTKAKKEAQRYMKEIKTRFPLKRAGSINTIIPSEYKK